MQEESMIAPCGINCTTCSIFIAANDTEYADKLAEEWRKTWQPKAQSDWFKCKGCRGDRSVCWCGDDCNIYNCCVAEKGLDLCNQCSDFPCAQLEEWGAAPEHHRKALEWLKETKE